MSAHPVAAHLPGQALAGLPFVTALLASMADGVMVTDAPEDPSRARIVFVNPTLCEMTGYEELELLGETPKLLQGPATNPAVVRRLREDLLAGRPFAGSATNYRKDGSTFTMEWTISHVPGVSGHRGWWVAVQRDALLPSRRLLAAEPELRVDPATGLANRLHLDDLLERGTWLGNRARCVVLLDVEARDAPLDEALDVVGRAVERACPLACVVARWDDRRLAVLVLEPVDADWLAAHLRAAAQEVPYDVAVRAGRAALGEGEDPVRRLLEAATLDLQQHPLGTTGFDMVESREGR